MILLDTHTWIWWAADRSRLSAAGLSELEQASELGVPAISSWEVAMLAAKGRLQLALPADAWIRQALSLPRIRPVPLTHEAALLAALLPLHGDPADRMIAATAIELGVPLMTKDDRLRKLDRLRTIW